MISVAALVSALDGFREEKRLQNANRIGKAVGFILFWVFGLLMTAGNCYFIWAQWQSAGDSVGGTLMFTALLALGAFFFEAMALIFLLVPSRPPQRNREIATALRRLIARNDDGLTPMANLQPRKAPPNEVTGHAITLQPIRATANTVASTWAIILVSLVMLPLLLICILAPLSSLMFSSGGRTIFSSFITPTLWPLLSFAIFALVIPLRIWTALNRRRGGVTRVFLDDQGIHYRKRRQDNLIAWSQIRSLAQIVVNPLAGLVATTSAAPPVGTGNTTYLIDSGTDLFVWSIAGNAKDDEFQAAETLLQHIATRTGLPLLDATGLATEIAQYGSSNASRMLMQRTRLDATESHSLVIVDALTPVAPAPKPSTLKLALIASVIAVLAVANGILPLAQFRLDHASSVYQANFISTMHATSRFYTTDLATNDGLWLEARASGKDVRSYFFQGGAYHLSGTQSECFVDSWPANAVGDMTDGAVEVTVSQSEQIPAIPHQDATGGAGVLFHIVSDGNRFIAFIMSTDLHWSLYHYRYVDEHADDNWPYLDGGFSARQSTRAWERRTPSCSPSAGTTSGSM